MTIIETKNEQREPVTFQKVSNVRSVIKLPDGGENFIDELEGDKESLYPDMLDEEQQRERVMSGMDKG